MTASNKAALELEHRNRLPTNVILRCTDHPSCVSDRVTAAFDSEKLPEFGRLGAKLERQQARAPSRHSRRGDGILASLVI